MRQVSAITLSNCFFIILVLHLILELFYIWYSLVWPRFKGVSFQLQLYGYYTH